MIRVAALVVLILLSATSCLKKGSLSNPRELRESRNRGKQLVWALSSAKPSALRTALLSHRRDICLIRVYHPEKAVDEAGVTDFFKDPQTRITLLNRYPATSKAVVDALFKVSQSDEEVAELLHRHGIKPPESQREFETDQNEREESPQKNGRDIKRVLSALVHFFGLGRDQNRTEDQEEGGLVHSLRVFVQELADFILNKQENQASSSDVVENKSPEDEFSKKGPPEPIIQVEFGNRVLETWSFEATTVVEILEQLRRYDRAHTFLYPERIISSFYADSNSLEAEFRRKHTMDLLDYEYPVENLDEPIELLIAFIYFNTARIIEGARGGPRTLMGGVNHELQAFDEARDQIFEEMKQYLAPDQIPELMNQIVSDTCLGRLHLIADKDGKFAWTDAEAKAMSSAALERAEKMLEELRKFHQEFDDQ